MRTVLHLYFYYRRCGASTATAARRALHVYRNGF
jgi:hypothetical protein